MFPRTAAALTNLSRPTPSVTARLRYLARIADVYLHRSRGPLSFWHERPELNERAFDGGSEYFMRFQGKAAYAGPFDDAGIPLLDYRGEIGRQYNPIAVAQYGLARFNRWSATAASDDRHAWIGVADWLVEHSRPNTHGVRVWMHDFDWPYRETLVAPWHSGLAQGVGLSMLIRAAKSTGAEPYASAADEAFEPFLRDVDDGGVVATDDRGHTWIEEYLVHPPSHILNGFIWALWGIYDHMKWSGSPEAVRLWNACVETLQQNLDDFDTGWWSLYEMPNGNTPMPASAYYHALHIVQLRVMHRLTGVDAFAKRATRFEAYQRNPLYRWRALAAKTLFKVRHY